LIFVLQSTSDLQEKTFSFVYEINNLIANLSSFRFSLWVDRSQERSNGLFLATECYRSLRLA